MAFGKHHAGHPFSDLLRDSRNKKQAVAASTSGTSQVGTLKGPPPKPGENKGGVSVSVPAAGSIPKPSAHMDGKTHPVPRGKAVVFGSRRTTSRKPAAIPQSTRLGNFGAPPSHTTEGADTPQHAQRESRTLPPHEQGREHKVKGKGRHGKPAWNIGDAHINHGTPKIGRARVRDLAAKI